MTLSIRSVPAGVAAVAAIAVAAVLAAMAVTAPLAHAQRARHAPRAEPAQPFECVPRCPSGDANECNHRGWSLLGTSRSIARDVSAWRCFRVACDAGVLDACRGLGEVSSRAALHTRELVDRVAEYRATLGEHCGTRDPMACVRMALLDVGAGRAREGLARLDRLCSGRVTHACLRLGHLHLAGRGASRDRRTALRYFSRACDLGNHTGCYLRDVEH